MIVRKNLGHIFHFVNGGRIQTSHWRLVDFGGKPKMSQFSTSNFDLIWNHYLCTRKKNSSKSKPSYRENVYNLMNFALFSSKWISYNLRSMLHTTAAHWFQFHLTLSKILSDKFNVKFKWSIWGSKTNKRNENSRYLLLMTFPACSFVDSIYWFWLSSRFSWAISLFSFICFISSIDQPISFR